MSEQPLDQTPNLAPAADRYSQYAYLFEMINNTSIVGVENKEWTHEELDARLIEAMRKAGEACSIANDGTIYMTLSGGVDSTLALAILHNLYPNKPIIAVVMGGSAKHEDVQFARLAARTFDIKLDEYIPDKDDVFNSGIADYKVVSQQQDLYQATMTGDNADYMLYSYLAKKYGVKSVISCDGIDEQLGGYPEHRWVDLVEEKILGFEKSWQDLPEKHLKPLIRIANALGIQVIFPYLNPGVVEYTSSIPIDERTTKSNSKIPLRILAAWHKVPKVIIERKKRGRLEMLNQE